MKVQNMKGKNGRAIPNQFIITGVGLTINNMNWHNSTVFQSYDSVIAVTHPSANPLQPHVVLDKNTWDYSKTTGRYRNQFLGETKKETQAKIDSGEYILTDLNG